ncbi:MAG TPA: FUSC family protein [Coxiellaceae bacterium]|nr:FUSC family protein [Coxiellaceae bacterium]
MFHLRNYPYADYHRTLICMGPIFLLMGLNVFINFSFLENFWLFLSGAMLSFTLTGANKIEQSINIFLFTFIAATLTLFTTWFQHEFTRPLFLGVLTLLIFLTLCLPRVLDVTANATRLLCLFITVAGSTFLVPPSDYSWKIVGVEFLAVLGGGLSCLLINLCLPKLSIEKPPLIRSTYLYKKSFRLALGILIAFIICDILKLTHPSWAAFAILFASRDTQPDSLHRAFERLTGTFAGVIVGVPLALVLFKPYPHSHFLILVFLMIANLVGKKSYWLAMFFVTVSFGALYYIVTPGYGSPTVFILERFAETALGVAILVSMEFFVFPTKTPRSA